MPAAPARRYDAVVVGGGHNGLVAGAVLARGGLATCVLERRDVLGGACVTEELWPGYRLSRASYAVSLLQPRIVRELELAAHGLRMCVLDPSTVHPWRDGGVTAHWEDGDRFRRDLAQFSREDADAHREYARSLGEVAALTRPLLMTAPPGLSGDGADLLGWLRFGLRGRAGRRHLADLIALFTLSAGDFLRRWFRHERTLAALCSSGVIGAWAGPETPGTAYVLLHHVVGEVNGAPGAWGLVEGGMGSIADALARAVRRHGGEVRAGAEVVRVRIDGGRATGVVLADGEEIDAQHVLLGCHPQTGLLGLVGAEHLPPDVVRDLGRYRSRSGVVKINAVLTEAPRFTAWEGRDDLPPGFGAEFMTHASLAEVEAAWDDARAGRASTRPFIDGLTHSLLDPSVVPEGSAHHTLSLFTQYGPYELADGRSWDDERDAYARRVFDLIGELAPNVPGAVLHHEVLAPPDLERIFGLVGGNIFHGEMAPDQLLSLRPAQGAGRYRTPVRGVWLCGSGAHPGGGVMGAPGWLAAHAVLGARRLRRA